MWVSAMYLIMDQPRVHTVLPPEPAGSLCFRRPSILSEHGLLRCKEALLSYLFTHCVYVCQFLGGFGKAGVGSQVDSVSEGPCSLRGLPR